MLGVGKTMLLKTSTSLLAVTRAIPGWKNSLVIDPMGLLSGTDYHVDTYLGGLISPGKTLKNDCQAYPYAKAHDGR